MFHVNLINLITLTLHLFRPFNGLEAARILAVLGIPNPAENVFGAALLNALNERGHNITVIIRFSHNMRLHGNITKVMVDENKEIFRDFLAVSASAFNQTLFHNVQKFYSKSASLTSRILRNPPVRKIVEHQQFDLVLLDTLMSEALYGLGEYLRAPMVGVSNFFNTENLDALTNNYSPLSIVPSLFLQHTFEPRFMQRFLNVAHYALDKLDYGFFNLPYQRQAYKEIFPNANLTFDQAQRNFSLVLLNQHFSLNFPRPLVPSMVEVAGLHIDEYAAPLPWNVQQFLNASAEHVVYVFLQIDAETLNIQSQSHLLLKLFSALKDLPYKVIWHSDLPLCELPSHINILQVSNISRSSILAHEHVKLYITNAELDCLIEAVYFGKPVLGLPYFAHQQININMATAAGYALGIKFRSFCPLKFKNFVTELITNPIYLKNVKHLSKIFHDQPMKPKENAVYWVEYVIRHNGAIHLMSKGRFLNFWQLHNIDVYLAYFAIFSLVIVLSLLLIEGFKLFLKKVKHIWRIKYKKN